MVKNKYKRINWLRALDLELVLASFGILKNSYNEYIVNGEVVEMAFDSHSIRTSTGKKISGAINLVQFVTNLDPQEGFEAAYEYLDNLDKSTLQNIVNENYQKIDEGKPSLFSN